MNTLTSEGTTLMLSAEERSELIDLGNQFRVDAIRASTASGGGHPTSAMSCADLLAVLLKRHYVFDWTDPKFVDNDRIVLSKGHISGLWYAAMCAANVLDRRELATYRCDGSPLQGHPTPELPWVDVATGSLGQGLGAAVGIAYSALHLEHRELHVWTLCGDGELAEGSMWEAFDKASVYGLRNLTAIVDVNGFGQSGQVPHQDPPATYSKRIAAFGWHVLELDGHDVTEIDKAMTICRESDRPTAIVAHCEKGHGFDEVVGRADMHGVAFDRATADMIVKRLSPNRHVTLESARRSAEVAYRPEPQAPESERVRLPEYTTGEPVEIRTALGSALVQLGEVDTRIVVIDGDVTASVRTEEFRERFPERFVQTYIAEQQMLGFAVGMATRSFRPVVSTYSAFLTRAFDFMRMATITDSTFVVAGSHCGVEIGRDGPSQMGLEDLAMARSLHRSTVLYPCDATAMGALLALAIENEHITYLRVTRGSYPVIYSASDKFVIGGANLLMQSDADAVTIVSAGDTVHEALRSARELAREGTRARVIDAYSVKPLNGELIAHSVAETGGRLVVVEDHRPEGGLGSAVFEDLALRHVMIRAQHLAVRNLPGCASPEEQIHRAAISSQHISQAVHELFDISGAIDQ